MNQPPDGPEGRLLGEIGRSSLAPQGICVTNSAGKVLAWSLMFDNDKAVGDFLDAAARRYVGFPDGSKRVDTERFMRFPSDKRDDTPDSGEAFAAPDRHEEGRSCPATPRVRRGTLVARLVGRRLDEHGAFMKETKTQENYVEDKFNIPVDLQEALAKATGDPIRLSDNLAKLFATYAYLGELDVRPLVSPVPGRTSDLKRCEFTATRDGERLKIIGRTEAAGGDLRRAGDGAAFQHDVTLDWTGVIELKDKRIARLALTARGTEHVLWKSDGFGDKNDVSRLPAGRPFNFTSDVRYGIVGEPVAESLAADRDEPFGPAGSLPRKMEKLQAGVKTWQSEGRDPSPIGEIMRDFEPLMKADKIGEAEAVIDRALAALEGKETPADVVGQKLRRLHERVQDLVRRGKRKEAEALLDKVLEDPD